MRIQGQCGNAKVTVSIIAGMTLLAGVFAYKSLTPGPGNSAANPAKPTIKATTIVGQSRPDFTMADVDNQQRNVSEWDGKVLLINFWATWCPPCRREIPAFIQLQENYHDKGLVIVGIALDTQQAAIDFVDPMGINYPILVGEIDGISLTQQYGNELGVLPYSVIIDRKGIIRETFRSEVTYEDAEKLITPFL